MCQCKIIVIPLVISATGVISNMLNQSLTTISLRPHRPVVQGWLRHFVTRRKVTGSIPDVLIGIFH
jgi:hypothetical protein